MPNVRPKSRPGEKKSDTTRRVLLERALVLFQKRGVEATTMRDIAKAAKMSLGAAYYYFPSKEALMFAYYADNQRAMEAAVETLQGTVREQVGALFHAKLAAIQPQKKMLLSIVPRLIDPSDELSAFAAESAQVRSRAIAILDKALEGAALPPAVRPLAAKALWLFQMAVLLLFVSDDTPGEERTHRLVDDSLDMIVPMLPLLATPMGAALAGRITEMLGRAGIA